jgi:DNA-binding transcriptional LysR family regulator
MTLRQLEIFIVVAHKLNLRKTSQELHIAQSSISHHLQLLHREFGKQLHRKVGSGIELTAAGTLFLKEARSIVSRIDGLRAKFRATTAEPVQSSLTVGGNSAASAKLLPLLMALFKKNHENVQLKLRTAPGTLLYEMVLKGDVDVALVQHKPASDQLVAELYSKDILVACVSPKHPLAKTTRLSPDDMRNFGFIGSRHPAEERKPHQFINMLEKRGFKPKLVLECNYAEAKKNAVKNQIGIGLFLKWSVTEELQNRELVELELPGNKLTSNCYIIYRKRSLLSPLARDFVELLRAHRDAQRR